MTPLADMIPTMTDADLTTLRANAARLGDAAGCEAYLLEGGLEAWKRAGLPVATDRKQPIEIMRQVQITAGSLVVVGVVLTVSTRRSFLKADDVEASPTVLLARVKDGQSAEDRTKAILVSIGVDEADLKVCMRVHGHILANLEKL